MGLVTRIRNIANRAPMGRRAADTTSPLSRILHSLVSTTDDSSNEVLIGLRQTAINWINRFADNDSLQPTAAESVEILEFVDDFVRELERSRSTEIGQLNSNVLFLAKCLRGGGLRNWRRNNAIRRLASSEDSKSKIESIISESEADTKAVLKDVKKHLHGMRSRLLVFDSHWINPTTKLYEPECFELAVSKYVDVSALSGEYVGLALIRIVGLSPSSAERIDVLESVSRCIRSTYRRQLDFAGLCDDTTIGLLVLDSKKKNLLDRVDLLRGKLDEIVSGSPIAFNTVVTILRIDDDSQSFLRRSLSELELAAKESAIEVTSS